MALAELQTIQSALHREMSSSTKATDLTLGNALFFTWAHYYLLWYLYSVVALALPK